MKKLEFLIGNCLDSLKNLPDNSVDSIVTDPPYGLSFMGKKWDYDVPSVEIWKEAFRVLKPGGHLLSFFGTRTYHRGVIKIEDAGFDIRDQIMWIYGSGFPKSTDVSKRIDKEAGAEREVIGDSSNSRNRSKHNTSVKLLASQHKGTNEELKITAPSTESAKQWQGWGSALKPANEPIVVARKPLEKGLTLAENVLKYGTGAINIDQSRIKCLPGEKPSGSGNGQKNTVALSGDRNDLVGGSHTPDQGRWPANIIFDETAAELLDEQSGTLKSGGKQGAEYLTENADNQYGFGKNNGDKQSSSFYGSSGGASRFFYVAKASKSERNKGLEGMPLVESGIKNDSGRGFSESDPHKKILNQNFHPTVKPIKLMEYLIKLVTPPNGTVLDPFMGSGSTGVAAKQLGFKFIGCEMSEEYMQIAEKRIHGA